MYKDEHRDFACCCTEDNVPPVSAHRVRCVEVGVWYLYFVTYFFDCFDGCGSGQVAEKGEGVIGPQTIALGVNYGHWGQGNVSIKKLVPRRIRGDARTGAFGALTVFVLLRCLFFKDAAHRTVCGFARTDWNKACFSHARTAHCPMTFRMVP